MLLDIRNLKASIDGKPILKGVNLSLESGEIHAVMGPNGSGKSTLANILMGNPEYEVTGGSISWGTTDLLELEPHERALAGIFLSYQYPVEIPGLTVGKFLKRAGEVRLDEGESLNVSTYLKGIRENMDFLEMDRQFINRYPQRGFLRRREEANGNPADAYVQAPARHSGRNRLGPGHRRPQDRI